MADSAAKYLKTIEEQLKETNKLIEVANLKVNKKGDDLQ